MRILYLCHRIPYPPNKGEKIRVFHQLRAMAESKALPGHSIYYFRAWPLIWGTLLTTVLAGSPRLSSLSTARLPSSW